MHGDNCHMHQINNLIRKSLHEIHFFQSKYQQNQQRKGKNKGKNKEIIITKKVAEKINSAQGRSFMSL